MSKNLTVNIRNQYVRNLKTTKKICYFGSSVSFMKKGWRRVFHDKLCELTGADHTEIDSTLGGTNIVSNSILIQDKVCGYNPDIVFFDFVINDKDTLSCPKDLIAISVEDSIRQILLCNPNCIIIFLYMHSKHANGHDWVMQIYDDIADKYLISSINIENHINNLPDSHNKYYVDSCHPNEDGISLIADIVMEGFQQIVRESTDIQALARPNHIHHLCRVSKPVFITRSVPLHNGSLSKHFYKLGDIFYQDITEVMVKDKFFLLCLEMIVGPETKGMITTLDGIDKVWDLQDKWTNSDRITHKIIYYDIEDTNHEVIIKAMPDSKLYLTKYFLRSYE